jgi:hypothetical protein
MIFESKIGFEAAGAISYYLGDEESFVIAKSNAGVLKLILPHIFAFGLLSMVVIHFLIFTKYKNNKLTKYIIYLILVSQFFEIFTPFLVINISSSFIYLKFISFFIYLTLIPLVLFIIFNSIVKD